MEKFFSLIIIFFLIIFIGEKDSVTRVTITYNNKVLAYLPPKAAIGLNQLGDGMRDILDEGYLTYLTQDCWERSTRKIPKLSTTELKQIATVYGQLCKHGNLYDLLFVEPKHRIQIGNKTVHTRDFANFTLLRYLKAPSNYWKPDTKQAYGDTAACTGVPLALLGARNVLNRSYMTWVHGIDVDNIEDVYKVDVFLGQGLSSTYLDPATGEKKWGKGRGPQKNGLIKHLYWPAQMFDGRYISTLRDSNQGYATNYSVSDCKEEFKNVEFFNDSSVCMKHLHIQGWCWYGNHRSTDMILCFSDWDKVPKSADSVISQLMSAQPKDNNIPPGIMQMMGDTYEDSKGFATDNWKGSLEKPKENTEDDLRL